MTLQAAYRPHGAAVLDYHRGVHDAVLICYQDGIRDDVPASFWFRDALDPLERLGLDMCCGRILDVGAGAGLHTLELQRRGADVVALDITPECGVVMWERGVKQPVVADLHEFNDGRFDSVILFCNGLDKVGRLTDLPRFLDRMRTLLNPGGQLLADSFDMRIGATPATQAEMSKKSSSGRYFGEADLMFEYAGRRGSEFTVLQVDPGTLASIARDGGWSFELVRQTAGHYLARLQPTSGH